MHDNCVVNIRRLQSLSNNKMDYKDYIYTNISCFVTMADANDGVSKIWNIFINAKDISEPTKPLIDRGDVLEIKRYKDTTGNFEGLKNVNIEAIKRNMNFYRIIGRQAQ